MKKAVLSNRIWVNYDEELYQKVKESLTYEIPSKVPNDPPVIKRLYSVIGHKFLTFPIGRIDLIPSDYTIVDKRTINPVEFPLPAFGPFHVKVLGCNCLTKDKLSGIS